MIAQALKSLRQWLGCGNRFGVAALQLSLRTLNIDEGRELIRSMAKDPGLPQKRHRGHRYPGRPDVYTVDHRSDALAGSGAARGRGLLHDHRSRSEEYRNLDRVPPAHTPEAAEAASDTSIDAEYESHLPWPEPDLVEQWWQANESQFTPGIRYLAGQPVTTESARQVLVSGNSASGRRQRSRSALLEPDERLFVVRSHAGAQKQQLGMMA